MKEDIRKNIEKAWTRRAPQAPRTRFWQSPVITKHIIQKICSVKAPQETLGTNALLHLGKFFKLGLSVGAGNAHKEIALLRHGLVEHFHIFELSKECIAQGKALAERYGLQDRISFYYEDFFKSAHNKAESYDLVYWDNALHHMLDTRFAVLTSYDILKRDGYFFCYDYVGKNRFQFSDLEIALINGMRITLPDATFKYRKSTTHTYPMFIGRVSEEAMMASDYSEAADSESILPAIRKYFPHAHIIPLGGLIYHMGLNDILENIPEDSALLQYLLDFDDKSIAHGFEHYAFTLAPKYAALTEDA